MRLRESRILHLFEKKMSTAMSCWTEDKYYKLRAKADVVEGMRGKKRRTLLYCQFTTGGMMKANSMRGE
jgi:hypothetical protein